MKLKSINKFCDASTPIYPTSHFTWGEATKDLTRKPEDLMKAGKLFCDAETIEQNIIKTAKYLDDVRDILGGHPLLVTSWYRPQKVNKAVGGGKNSQHLYGLAVDFYSNYISPTEIYQRLEGWHGSKGGIAKYYNFVHLDLRGYRARW